MSNIRFPWYRRIQVEVGGRWQLVPSGSMTFREWLFDPFAGFTWPGKYPVTRADVPDGEIHGGIELRSNNPTVFEALVWWARLGVRVLGLDIGVAVFVRSRRSIEKLTNTIRP